MKNILDGLTLNLIVLVINGYFAFHEGAIINAVAFGLGICNCFDIYDKKRRA